MGGGRRDIDEREKERASMTLLGGRKQAYCLHTYLVVKVIVLAQNPLIANTFNAIQCHEIIAYSCQEARRSISEEEEKNPPVRKMQMLRGNAKRLAGLGWAGLTD